MGKKVLALDIGGTNTRAAIVNEDYKIEEVVINPTKVGNVANFLSSVSGIIREICPDLSGISAIAMGVPGRVRADGFIYALPNVHIDNIPLGSYLEKQFGLPVFVRNDAEVATLAEANDGPYAKFKSLYFITISTGVGGALTVDGKLRPCSGESGHTLFPYKGELYEFEHIVSGTGLVTLCKLNNLPYKNAAEFFSHVNANDPEVMPAYNEWIGILASYINMTQEAYQPEVFTLTGGVMKSADIFFEDLKKACPNSRIERCSHDQYAGLIGAAVYGFQSIGVK